MNIWNDGRYASNIAWVAQLLDKGGVEELNKWLTDQPQLVQNDILLMMNQLVLHLEDTIDPRVKYGPNYQPLEEDHILGKWASTVSEIPKKPKLYLVKKDENNG